MVTLGGTDAFRTIAYRHTTLFIANAIVSPSTKGTSNRTWTIPSPERVHVSPHCQPMPVLAARACPPSMQVNWAHASAVSATCKHLRTASSYVSHAAPLHASAADATLPRSMCADLLALLVDTVRGWRVLGALQV